MQFKIAQLPIELPFRMMLQHKIQVQYEPYNMHMALSCM